jgi:hypothetical protein
MIAPDSLPKVFYLHQNFQKFWEIVIDPSTTSTKERSGNLTPSGQEDIMNIHTKTTLHRTYEEALNSAQMLLNQKNMEGYASFEKPSSPFMNINNIPLTTSIMPSAQKGPISESSLEKSGSLRLKRKPKEDLVREDQKMVKKSEGIRNKRSVEFSPEDYENNSSGLGTRIVNFFKNLVTPAKEDEKDSVGRELPISSRVYKHAGVIQKKAKDLNLKCEVHEDAVMVLGDVRKVDLLEDFLKDLEEENARNEIELSTVLRGMPDMILKKAQELNVRCEFFDRKLVVKGNHEDVDDLMEYLGELETSSLNANANSKYPSFIPEETKIDTMHTMNTMGNAYHGHGGYHNYGPELQPMMSSHIPVAPINSFGEENPVLNAIQSVHDTLNGVKKAVDLLETKEKENAKKIVNTSQDRSNGGMMEISYKKQNSFEKLFKESDQRDYSGSKTIKSEDYASAGTINKDIKKVNQNAHDSLDDMARRIEMIEAQINNQRATQNQLDLAKPFSELVRAMGDKVKGIAHTYSSLVGSHLEGLVSTKDQGEYIQKEIARPQYLRPCPEDVKKKARELGIELDVTFEVFLALGFQSALDKFTVYLMDANLKAQKALFPQYWNLLEDRPYSLVLVSHESQEFKEVTRTFTSYMTSNRICSLERIQNKNLMNRYINHIQGEKELRKTQDLQRRQLFYGTGAVNPTTLFDSNGNGFDPRYADFQTSKGFGRGFCFAVNPYHCHNQAHRTSNGRYQILVADVFVGKSCQSGPGNLIKAPKGFDSVSQNSELFVVYDEAQSCPLYLIEYN